MKLYNADCLQALKEIAFESIDLIYLDPPFFTQKQQTLSDKEGNIYSFNDSWDSIDDYLEFMKQRLALLHKVLKPTGSIYIHCDNSASHYLKVLMDNIFDIKNFRSEIIWNYKRWSNSKKGFLNSHQTIFYYTKSDNFIFNKIFTDYSSTTNIDQILQDRIRDENNKSIYKKDSFGNAISSKDKIGVPLSDVWDIPFLNPKSKERVGYPTQKPIELLERIIKVSSNEKDVILDPFCGCGTTLVAAQLLNREFIGIDVSQQAIDLAKKRLDKPIKTESALLKNGIEAFENKNDYYKQILSNFDCNIVQRNKGLDAILKKKKPNGYVGIKIQQNTETLQDSIDFALQATKNKEFEKIIVIQTGKETLLIEPPEKITIVQSYAAQLSDIN